MFVKVISEEIPFHLQGDNKVVFFNKCSLKQYTVLLVKYSTVSIFVWRVMPRTDPSEGDYFMHFFTALPRFIILIVELLFRPCSSILQTLNYLR